ncbi:unnamed protein product [Prunus armeniaca]
MVFGQVVIGPLGSGKTTYCNGMSQFLQLIGSQLFLSLCTVKSRFCPWMPSLSLGSVGSSMSTLEASTVLHSHSSPTSVLASILHLTIASLPSSPSTAAPVPSSSNHQPPATATTPPPFSLSLARALDFSLSNTHSALPQFVCFGCFPFWVEVFAGAKLISGQYVCLCSDFQVLQSANHVSGDFIIKMPMLTAPSTIVSSPILPAGSFSNMKNEM